MAKDKSPTAKSLSLPAFRQTVASGLAMGERLFVSCDRISH